MNLIDHIIECEHDDQLNANVVVKHHRGWFDRLCGYPPSYTENYIYDHFENKWFCDDGEPCGLLLGWRLHRLMFEYTGWSLAENKDLENGRRKSLH